MFYRTDEPHGLKHNPFKALVAPRPIAWVSTVDVEGRVNLAPYSYFNAVADNPPQVMFAPNGYKADGSLKDTLVNAEAMGEFVVNIPHFEVREAMNATAMALPWGVDEMALASLTPVASQLVKPPRVAEAKVSLECRFTQRLQLQSPEGGANNVVFGQVVGIHISDDLIIDGMVSIERHRPICRLGYQDYSVVDRVFQMPRPGLSPEAVASAKGTSPKDPS